MKTTDRATEIAADDRTNVFSLPKNRQSLTGEFREVMWGINQSVVNQNSQNSQNASQQLLYLQQELTQVTERKELLFVLNNRLAKLVKFSHSLITISDQQEQTYTAFATDHSPVAQQRNKYLAAIHGRNMIQDGIYELASANALCTVLDMKARDLRKTPLWFRLNYAVGSREMLIKILPGNKQVQFALILFSDEPENFNAHSQHVIEQLSGTLCAVALKLAAQEQLRIKEKQNSFLLDFCQSLAGVETKTDLENIVCQTLQSRLNIRVSIISILNEDGTRLVPYIIDKSSFRKPQDSPKEFSNRQATDHQELSQKLLVDNKPVLLDFQDSASLNCQHWQGSDYQHAFGVILTAGREKLGVMWLLTDLADLQLLSAISAQISLAISSLRAKKGIPVSKNQLGIARSGRETTEATRSDFSGLIGNGKAMLAVQHLIATVAPSTTTTLILGETGTGKELIARAIHNFSPRSQKPMIKINCAALPPQLIESELFGHEKGAFTGANERRIGKFELAEEGTIFLDEIGELPLDLQVKLLRVLQEREFERLGGQSTITVDVRIIAATNRNLTEEVRHGRFRADLFYRLNVFPIALPPLKERTEDIQALSDFFLSRFRKKTGIQVKAISAAALAELKAYPWPGNVRELEHTIEKSILLSGGGLLTEFHLPKATKPVIPSPERLYGLTLQEMERNHIIDVLLSCRGKISGLTGAAAILDIPPSTLHSKLKKLKIKKEQYLLE